MNPGVLVACLVYIITGRVIVRNLRGAWRQVLFACLNLTGFFWLFYYGRNRRELTASVVYLLIVLIQYATMRAFARNKDWKAWLAFLTPIAALIAIHYVPASFYAMASPGFAAFLRAEPTFSWAPYFVGISYLAFRSSYLVLEVRNGAVEKPGFWEYLGFCFFLPTVSVGPISQYQTYRRAFDSHQPSISINRSLARIVVGLVKLEFLGKLCDQLTYSGLLRDDHYHPWVDLPVAVVFYYLFLYCNFSGFCDVAIGIAGLIGVAVDENFNNPFAARNVREFWNRWHITLSRYMRDVVFAPLSKYLARLLGAENTNHAVALAIAVVFLMVGIWHGVGWNYAAFGIAHTVGLVIVHYYSIGLKKWLGRDGMKAYLANPWIHSAAVTLTFCYCAAALFFFANTFPEMKEIFASLR